ncbi:hypothetical protein CKA32_001103 [Geitlerinema sp. FC II]|nr:hypothetical protein CKA32_001103 [Geitlerinema sp. FC II]
MDCSISRFRLFCDRTLNLKLQKLQRSRSLWYCKVDLIF